MRDALRQLGGLGHMIRPENVKTPQDFNAHLDVLIRVLKEMKVSTKAAREEQGTGDRMESGPKQTREVKRGLTKKTFGEE